MTLGPESSPPVNSPFNPGRPADLAGTNFEKHAHVTNIEKKSLSPRGSDVSDSLVEITS